MADDSEGAQGNTGGAEDTTGAEETTGNTLLTGATDNTNGEGENKSEGGDGEGGEEKTGDEKTGDDKTGEDKTGEDKSDKGAPEKYEDFVLPEGVDKLDQDMLDNFTALAKEQNLSQESAQKLVELASGLVLKTGQDSQAAWQETADGWVKAVKEDKDYGGEHLKETLTRGERALARFGSPDLGELIGGNGFRLTDNLEFIKFLVRVDKAIGEDKLVEGGSTGDAGATSHGASMYGGDTIVSQDRAAKST